MREEEKTGMEDRVRELWEQGYSDGGIAREVGWTDNRVRLWRGKNRLCENIGKNLEKNELRDRLPQVGDILIRKPYFMGDEQSLVKAEKCQVVYVNREHLFYTCLLYTSDAADE